MWALPRVLGGGLEESTGQGLENLALPHLSPAPGVPGASHRPPLKCSLMFIIYKLGTKIPPGHRMFEALRSDNLSSSSDPSMYGLCGLGQASCLTSPAKRDREQPPPGLQWAPDELMQGSAPPGTLQGPAPTTASSRHHVRLSCPPDQQVTHSLWL